MKQRVFRVLGMQDGVNVHTVKCEVLSIYIVISPQDFSSFICHLIAMSNELVPELVPALSTGSSSGPI